MVAAASLAEEHRERADALRLVNWCIGCFSDSSATLGLLDGLPDALARVVDLLLHQRRQHPARADGVAGDAVVGGFERHRLGQADEAVLGGDVGDLLGVATSAVRRGDVDDAAPFALLHAGHRGADGVERRRQVDGDDRVPFLDREILDRWRRAGCRHC